MNRRQGEARRGVLQDAQEGFLRIDMSTVAWLRETLPEGLSTERNGIRRGARSIVCIAVKVLEHEAWLAYVLKMRRRATELPHIEQARKRPETSRQILEVAARELGMRRCGCPFH